MTFLPKRWTKCSASFLIKKLFQLFGFIAVLHQAAIIVRIQGSFSLEELIYGNDQQSSSNQCEDIIEAPTGVKYRSCSTFEAPDQNQSTEELLNEQREAKEIDGLNVLLFYADDWSFTTLGAMGHKVVKTPRLDELASKGMLFTHNCVTTSVCMVSRATLYTGQYASRHQTWNARGETPMYKKEVWEKTLFPVFQSHGYYTGLVGKYHHDARVEELTGVSTFDVFKPLNEPFVHFVRQPDLSMKHVTQMQEDDAIEFLQTRPKDKKFSLTVSFFATHAEDGSREKYHPMESSSYLYQNETVPHPTTYTEEHNKAIPQDVFNQKNIAVERAKGRYTTHEEFQHNMKNTYRMATEVDTACGRILDELERQGILNSTLVIFTTDNGNMHGQHGISEKWYAYEESLRVPLIIMDPRMPEHVRGQRSDEFTLNIDLAPTMLAGAGIPIPDVMQGRDMAELYTSNDRKAMAKTWRKEFLYEYKRERIYSKEQLPNNFALVSKDEKYINWYEFGVEELFNLNDDPFEERNIFDEALSKDQSRIDDLKMRTHTLLASAAIGEKM